MKLCTLDTYGGKLLSKAAIDAQFDVVSKKTVFKDRLKFIPRGANVIKLFVSVI